MDNGSPEHSDYFQLRRFPNAVNDSSGDEPHQTSPPDTCVLSSGPTRKHQNHKHQCTGSYRSVSHSSAQKAAVVSILRVCRKAVACSWINICPLIGHRTANLVSGCGVPAEEWHCHRGKTPARLSSSHTHFSGSHVTALGIQKIFSILPKNAWEQNSVNGTFAPKPGRDILTSLLPWGQTYKAKPGARC